MLRRRIEPVEVMEHRQSPSNALEREAKISSTGTRDSFATRTSLTHCTESQSQKVSSHLSTDRNCQSSRNQHFDPPILSNCRDDNFHRQAYRMTPAAFSRLCHIISPHLSSDSERSKALRVSVALRYFAGGNSVMDHHEAESVVNECVRDVVYAINTCEELKIEFPESKIDQAEIAASFEMIRCCVGFDNCAGSIGGMLLHTHTDSDNKDEYFCQTKKRHGIFMQGICDHNGKFLDISFASPTENTAISVFKKSEIGRRIEEGTFLNDGLVLYGNALFMESPFVVTPAVASSLSPSSSKFDSSLRDDFNTCQKQLGERIEQAFSDLVQRWGLLQRPLPSGIGIERLKDLVSALCKLQNFCIDDHEPMHAPLSKDLAYGFNLGATYTDNRGFKDEFLYTEPSVDQQLEESKQTERWYETNEHLLGKVIAHKAKSDSVALHMAAELKRVMPVRKRLSRCRRDRR